MIRQLTTRFKLVLCIKSAEYPASLEPRKIYCALADREAALHGLIRVIDESGEDYLYPADYFVRCPLSKSIREALLPWPSDRKSRVRRPSSRAAPATRAGRNRR